MKAKHLIGISACALLLGACSFISGMIFDGKPKTQLVALEVIAEPGANQNTATALDIVFVYDAAAIELLPKSGPAWFEAKAELLNTFPQGIDVVSLQIPPARNTTAPLPKRRASALHVVAYANYLSAAGQLPINLTKSKIAAIRLKPTAIDWRGK